MCSHWYHIASYKPLSPLCRQYELKTCPELEEKAAHSLTVSKTGQGGMGANGRVLDALHTKHSYWSEMTWRAEAG